MSEKDEDNAAMCYVAEYPCGCNKAVTVDMPEHKKDTALFVAECIKDGATIHRMTVAQFKAGSFGCDCKKDKTLPLFPEPEATG